MNRTERLEEMLPSWARIENIKDIIIVDWSSKAPIIENTNIQKILEKFNKIKIVRVENEDFFHICKSNNIGFQFTDKENEILLKLDVDYVNIDESWMDYLALKETNNKFYLKEYFLVGSYKFYQSSNGFLLVNKNDFKNVKGYNENYSYGWGGEDVDLYNRIYKNNRKNSKNKIFQKIIFFDIKKYIYHIPHDNELRYCNYPPEQKLSQKGEGEWEFQKYEILSQIKNYTRISLKNK
jgi:hypothetical protein